MEEPKSEPDLNPDTSDNIVNLEPHSPQPFEIMEPENITRFPNTYAAKKTVAQGMMDIALITANANQLRYLLEYSRDSPTFEVNVALIIISLIVQFAVGISLIFKGRYDLQGEEKRKQANQLNNYVVVGIFIVTVINVFVAAFSITAAPPSRLSHMGNTISPAVNP